MLCHATLIFPDRAGLRIILWVLLCHDWAALPWRRSLHTLACMWWRHSRWRIRIILRLMLCMTWRVLIPGLSRTADTWLMTSHANRWWHRVTIPWRRMSAILSMVWWNHSLSTRRWMHVHTWLRVWILSTGCRHSLLHHSRIGIGLHLLVFWMVGIHGGLWTSSRLFFDKAHLMEHLGHLITSLCIVLMLPWISLASHLLRLSRVSTLASRPGSHWIVVLLLVFLILLYRILHLFLIN